MHQHHQADDGNPHDQEFEIVIAVVDGNLAQAAAADDTGHGAVAQDGGHGDGASGNQAGQGFRQHHLGDDLPGACPHALGGLHHTLVHLPQAALYHSGHQGESGDDHGGNGGDGAHLGPHDNLGQGQADNHQD